MKYRNLARVGDDLVATVSRTTEKGGAVIDATVDLWMQGNGMHGVLSLSPTDAEKLAAELQEMARIARIRDETSLRAALKAAFRRFDSRKRLMKTIYRLLGVAAISAISASAAMYAARCAGEQCGLF